MYQKSNLPYTRVVTPERVMGGGANLRGLALEQLALKKHRSGGETLATLCPV